MHFLLVLGGREAFGHRFEQAHVVRVLAPRGVDDLRVPPARERPHALAVGHVDLRLTAHRLALRERVDARIDQSQARNPFRGEAHHFERDPAAHREPGQREALGGAGQCRPRHPGNRIVPMQVRDCDRGEPCEVAGLVLPHALVAQRARHENEILAGLPH